MWCVCVRVGVCVCVVGCVCVCVCVGGWVCGFVSFHVDVSEIILLRKHLHGLMNCSYFLPQFSAQKP